jgi:acetolactate synthase-1/2/3 large subunit
MIKRSTADILIDAMVESGMRHLFCLPGVQNDHFFDALHPRTGALRPIHSRHEQGAAYMALGAALATGRPQAYCVVPGPGFLNTTAALSTAYATNAPVFSLAGQIPSGALGKGRGLLHEIPDQLAITRGLTKWAERINSADEAAAKTREAFRQLTSGRPRPVGLEVPQNIWAEEGEPLPSYRTADDRPTLDEDAIAQAAKRLGGAKRPMIVVGGGAADCGAEIKRLAEMLSAPVVSFRNGKGILDARHPMACAMPEGHALWPETDAVLAVGTRLQTPQMIWGTDSDINIIQIDIDAEELGRNGNPEIAILADARDALPKLADAIETRNITRPGRTDAIAQAKSKMAQNYAETFAPQLGFLEVIRDELPDDGIFVDELTQVGYVSRFAYPVHQPRTFLSSGYQGTLGWGLATALGAKVVKPDVPVLSVSGDGGFMYNVQELATAVRHDIAVVAVVFNDGAFGNVKRMQQEQFDGRTIASDLANPDFAKLAESFGAMGLVAHTPEDLRGAIKKGFAGGGPVVIEVPCGTFPSPWDYVLLPKVRG